MSVPVATILSEGEAMDIRWELLSLDVDKQVNRIPLARLELIDGSAPEQRFEISDTAFFEPGKAVEIRLRYEGEDEATVFEGVVVRHGVELRDTGSILKVELKDAALVLTQARKSAVFRDMSDDEVVKQLVGDAGLEAGEIEATTPKHVELVQYYASDWDFILSRADVLGLLVSVDDGAVSLRKMAATEKAAHSFEYGISEIYDLDLDIDASRQAAAVSSFAWDIKNQARTEVSEAEAVEATQGNLDGAKLGDALGFSSYTLTHTAAIGSEELQAWADARMARSRRAMVRGMLAVAGQGDFKPLQFIELTGIGERFDGEALVSGVRHVLDHDGWRTELTLGLDPEWFCHREGIAEVPAGGLLPAVRGLQVGVVDAFEEDPDGEHRVKVRLPMLDEDHGPVWARLARPDAGNERGVVAWPEPDDEVVVGFFDADPRQAVVLGSLFSSVNVPPEAAGAPSEDNFKRAIVTKEGTTIVFDDEKVSVTVETPGGNSIAIDDDDESIILSDKHGNTITMNADGIKLESAADFKVDASGDVEIKGSAVDVK